MGINLFGESILEDRESQVIPLSRLSMRLRDVLLAAAVRETRPVLSLDAVILAALDEPGNDTVQALGRLGVTKETLRRALAEVTDGD